MAASMYEGCEWRMANGEWGGAELATHYSLLTIRYSLFTIRHSSAGPRRLWRQGRCPADRRGVILDRSRASDEITLHLIAAFARQESELFLAFDTFRDDRQI